MTLRRSARALLLVVPLVVAACGGGDDGDQVEDAAVSASSTIDDPTGGSDAAGAGPVQVTQVEASPREDVVSGLSIARGGVGDGAPEPLVDLLEIISGGPPPDGIPSIDQPVFLRVGDVEFLADNEPVLALEIDGDARAYPVQVLMWHEIVNDTVAGVPVAVTYCPLCNSAIAYDRRVEGRVMEFGTSGLLWNSALVMYDRPTETLWSHFTGQGIVGVLTGVELETFPVATVPWSVWRDAHPDGLVLSRDTGFDRAYGENPYPGYDDVTNSPFLFEGEVDGRYTAMTRIAGVERDGAAVGVPLVTLQDRGVVTAELDETDLVFFWQPGTASALDADEIADGDDIGATGVFVPVVDDQALTFAASETGFVDDQTGSTWNLLGQAVDGPLAGSRLEAIPHVDTFWFAWAAFRPDTVIVDG
jgi:hypothetical protein